MTLSPVGVDEDIFGSDDVSPLVLFLVGCDVLEIFQTYTGGGRVFSRLLVPSILFEERNETGNFFPFDSLVDSFCFDYFLFFNK